MKKQFLNSLTVGKVGLVIGLLAGAPSGLADTVAFEWLPGQNSQQVSRHGVNGPVLADDFSPAVSGWVTDVEWWGSAPSQFGDAFEITFHANAQGVPAAQLPLGGIAQHMTALIPGVLDPMTGTYYYQTAWAPQDVFVNAGDTYWFSVADASQPFWTWANPAGAAPTVGTEQFNGQVSVGVGPNGGPHFGPWNQAGAAQDFSFRIHVAVPESAEYTALLACVFLGILSYNWRAKGTA